MSNVCRKFLWLVSTWNNSDTLSRPIAKTSHCSNLQGNPNGLAFLLGKLLPRFKNRVKVWSFKLNVHLSMREHKQLKTAWKQNMQWCCWKKAQDLPPVFVDKLYCVPLGRETLYLDVHSTLSRRAWKRRSMSQLSSQKLGSWFELAQSWIKGHEFQTRLRGPVPCSKFFKARLDDASS